MTTYLPNTIFRGVIFDNDSCILLQDTQYVHLLWMVYYSEEYESLWADVSDVKRIKGYTMLTDIFVI